MASLSRASARVVCVVLLLMLPIREALRTAKDRNSQRTPSAWPHDKHQRDVISKNIGVCVDPENPDMLNSGEAAWNEHIWSKMDRDSPTGVDGWANHPFGMPSMPLHMMVGLLRNESKYPQDPPEDFNVTHNADLDSACFDFDYDREGEPDPAGCRVFAKSFKPLQQLRSCIVDHLEMDPIWWNRESMIMDDGKFRGSYREWCAQSVWSYLKFGPFKVPAKLCGRFDSKRRAQEMIKMVLFKPMSDSVDDSIKLVERKVCRSVTWPQNEGAPPCLEPATVTGIRSQCFKVKTGSSMKEAQLLGKVGPCLPLMFDKVEIQGFGLNDGIAKFQDEGYYGNPEQALRQEYTPTVPSLCGRLALASIPRFQTAKYALTSVKKMIPDAMAWDTEPSWNGCLNVKKTNCRKMYFCWERALRRMCTMSSMCCPGTETEAREVHNACILRPNNGLCKTALGTHSGRSW